MKKIPFKVSARAARVIGRENVATSQGAVTELVKNAYDADASACAIFFLRRHAGIPKALSFRDYAGLSTVLKDADSYYSDRDGTFELMDVLSDEDMAALTKGLDDLVDLWIVDNGKGMSPQTIEDSWMVIGTDAKEFRAKSDGGRILTGAKGIGRFALDRLGQECDLYSGERNSKEVVHWVVDWGDFEGEGKIIGDVTAVLETEAQSYQNVLAEIGLDALLPTQIPVRSDIPAKIPFSHRTAIGISLLHDIWDQRDSLKLKETLEALLPPKDRGDFNIFVYDHRSSEASGWIDNFPPDQFDYKLHADVRNEGTVAITIHRQEIDVDNITPTFFTQPGMQNRGFRKEDFEKGKWTYETKLADIVAFEDGESEADLVNIGPLDFTLYFFKLSNPAADNLSKYPQSLLQNSPRLMILSLKKGDFRGI